MDEFNQLSKTELLQKCEERNLKRYKSKTKSELVELLRAHGPKLETPIPTCNMKPLTESTEKSLLDYINGLLATRTLDSIAGALNVATGTVARWIELRSVPKQYEFDILKMSGVDIDYSRYPTKEKDQFFTPTEVAHHCFQTFCNTIRIYGENPEEFVYIEPSAGDGRFLSVLPENTIAIDIEPRHPSVIRGDYLTWTPVNASRKYVVFGNPPFGLRGHLALKFINHSYAFADYVCFILPQLFESDGKGVPRKRVHGYHLVHSSKLATDFYEPDGNTVKINTIFQIWSKHHKNDAYDIKQYSNTEMRIYSMSDGGAASTTRNKNMIGKCDVYLPSTCFGKENMKCYYDFEELPNRKGYGIVFDNNKALMLEKMESIPWSQVAFLSTNSAYNLRSSQIHELFANVERDHTIHA